MKIKKYISHLKNIIETEHGVYGLDELKIKKDLKSIRILGQYNPNSKVVHINKKLFKVNKKKYLKIIRHEYAHFVCDLLFDNIQSHGKEWKSIMRDLGEDSPSATTSDFSKEIRKAYPSKFVKLKCKCSIYNISIFRKRFVKKKRCSYCGKKIK